MPLTPKEIEQKTFTASFRGYAEDEVDVFLEEVIVSISEYQQMIRDRDARLGGSQAAAAAHLDGSPVASNEEANRIVQAAHRQAAGIIERAKAEADEITAKAAAVGARVGLSEEEVAERDRLIAGYQRLKDELGSVRARVQKALSASNDAFGIVERQIGGIVESATPDETDVHVPDQVSKVVGAFEDPEEVEGIEELGGEVAPEETDGTESLEAAWADDTEDQSSVVEEWVEDAHEDTVEDVIEALEGDHVEQTEPRRPWER